MISLNELKELLKAKEDYLAELDGTITTIEKIMIDLSDECSALSSTIKSIEETK